LQKADEAKRAAFVEEYAALRAAAAVAGAKHFFVDEARFYADADLRGLWVLKGTPALVDSTSPRYGEKASYYSAVCPETGEIAAMPLEGNSTAETSVAFLRQLRARHPEPLVVSWDNAPAHGGEPLREYLATPGLRLLLVRLPAYSPDFNATEHLWDWARAEVTANTCFGTAAAVRAHLDPFFAGLATRAAEVKRRCPRCGARRHRPAPRGPTHATDSCRSHRSFGLGPCALPRCRFALAADLTCHTSP
jgi:transposase